MSQIGVKAVRWRRAARSRGKSGAVINRAYRADPPGIKQERGLSSSAMAYLSGKQAFLQILKTEGVSVMFGNPGTTELPLMDGLAREPGIRYVLALQEAVAISMADAYAQAHGGLAAVNVHVSPGLGNAMGMLYDAYKAHSPLLLTAGQHDQSFTVTEPILWSDLPPVATPFVKWSTEARRLEDLPRIVRRAVKTALAQPSGPVFLSLPVDVLNAERDNLDLLASTRVAPRLVGDRAAIDAAAKRLVAANAPLIVAGDAVAHSDALAELVELAELIGAPVMLEGVSSTCSFPFTHPLYAGSMPRLGPGIKGLLMRHDLLFSVGGDLFTLSLPSDVDPMPPGFDVVHLDVDPWELGKNYPAAVAIQADPKASLPELCEAVRRHAGKNGHKDAGKRREALAAKHARERDDLARRAADEAKKSPMGPLALVHAVSQIVPDDVVGHDLGDGVHERERAHRRLLRLVGGAAREIVALARVLGRQRLAPLAGVLVAVLAGVTTHRLTELGQRGLRIGLDGDRCGIVLAELPRIDVEMHDVETRR